MIRHGMEVVIARRLWIASSGHDGYWYDRMM